MLTLLLDLGPGEKGMTEKWALLSKRKIDDLVLLNHQDKLGLLSLDAKNWSLDRRPWNPSFKGAIWPPLRGDRDSVTSVVALTESRVLEGARAVSQTAPSWTFPFECPSCPPW
jgi:hypothetical protein